MNMRHMIALAAVASAAVAGMSAPIQGAYNTALGWRAGEDAIYAERTTATGAGSAALANGAYHCSYYGAGAGLGATNLVDCIAIGHNALRSAEGCTNVVAIGSDALRGLLPQNHNYTWINGQFCASPERGISIRSTPDEEKPPEISGWLQVMTLGALEVVYTNRFDGAYDYLRRLENSPTEVGVYISPELWDSDFSAWVTDRLGSQSRMYFTETNTVWIHESKEWWLCVNDSNYENLVIARYDDTTGFLNGTGSPIPHQANKIIEVYNPPSHVVFAARHGTVADLHSRARALEGNVYDMSTKAGIVHALRDVVIALGGSWTNSTSGLNTHKVLDSYYGDGGFDTPAIQPETVEN